MNSALLLSSWGRAVGRKLTRGNRKWKEVEPIKKWNIVRGDLVHVIQGPQTGQQGKVLKIIRSTNRLLIEGINMRTRHIKPQGPGSVGKRVVRPCAVHYSNVMLVDPITGKPTKVSRKYLDDGSKVRVSRGSGHLLPKPDPLADRKIRSSVLGVKDTPPASVFAVTFEHYEKYLRFLYSKSK